MESFEMRPQIGETKNSKQNKLSAKGHQMCQLVDLNAVVLD